MATALYTRKFNCSSIGQNSNKFWNVTLFDNWNVECRWGRQGEDGQSKIFPHSSKYAAEAFIEKKVQEKLNKGGGKASYVEFHDAANGQVAPSRSQVSVPQLKLAEVAKSQIAHQDPLVAQLITRLANANKHNILGATTLKYHDSGQYKGLFATPQGVVTPRNISVARGLLGNIGDAIGGSRSVGVHQLEKWVEDYMMLVPVDIGRRRLTVSEVFPSLNAVRRQNDVLDSLDASLLMISQGVLEEVSGKDEAAPAVPKVFDVRLALADATVTVQVEKMFKDSLNRSHESSSLHVARVLEVDISAMTQAFESKGKPIGNIRRLWHGTRTANVLSILKSGLVIPPANSSHCTGRMFGDGLYGSDQSTKSLNYSYGYWDGGTRDRNCIMFVCDFAMGKTYTPTGGYGGSYPKAGYDSVSALAGKSGVHNNEFIVYRTAQVNIVYLVEFSG